MIIIGLTGSIGMGKSETSKMFAAQNIPVFDSDQAVHQLLGPKGAAVDIIEKIFSGCKKENEIDRQALGAQVFGNDSVLKKLEGILHPMVQKMRDDFVKTAGDNGQQIVLFDIPLLFEKNHQNDCDYIVVASAAADVQKKRVMERDGMSEQKFLDILEKQTPDQEKRRRADFIIQTDQGLDYAKDQVCKIIQKIREKHNASNRI
jgi:dephospho-CoA kinase